MEKEIEKSCCDESNEPKQPRKICIPCEDNDFSKKIIEWTKSNIIQPSDQVILVTARHSTVHVGKSWPKAVIDFVNAYNQKEDDKVIHRLESLKSLLEPTKTEIKVLHGDTKRDLQEFIEDLSPGVCVVGRSGMKEAKRMLVGSSSEYLMKHLKVPTLLYNF